MCTEQEVRCTGCSESSTSIFICPKLKKWQLKHTKFVSHRLCPEYRLCRPRKQSTLAHFECPVVSDSFRLRVKFLEHLRLAHFAMNLFLANADSLIIRVIRRSESNTTSTNLLCGTMVKNIPLRRGHTLHMRGICRTRIMPVGVCDRNGTRG
ncbi:hypothetical protein CJF31_00001650 [Rutstroemia sp. NJR-2017a BVV2]|nr:hypothetical protein CJF31_00001650 [Rutstroemia sp. NJR-2017a BVV2]